MPSVLDSPRMLVDELEPPVGRPQLVELQLLVEQLQLAVMPAAVVVLQLLRQLGCSALAIGLAPPTTALVGVITLVAAPLSK